MLDVPVFYATTDGHTRRIAEHMATVLRGHGLSSEALDVASPQAEAVDWLGVRAAAVCASVHAGEHQRVAEAFARRHRAELSARPSLFVSVCLSICSSRPEEVAAARRIADAFPERVGWFPARVASVGGRLAYTQYGFLKRWVMRSIAARAGGPTDTTRDYDLTDWNQVSTLAEDLALASMPVRVARAGRRSS
jgi:menaquinone-dependent protoporphyrinogen oxidase